MTGTAATISHPTATRVASWTSGFLLLALLLVPASARPQSSSGGPGDASGWVGSALSDALRDLRSRGLSIVFTEELVRPDMTVDREPRAEAPRDILEELLAAHGLAIVEARDGTLVVVPGDPASRLAMVVGRVRSPETGVGVPGAEVRLLEAGLTATTGSDGRFAFSGLEPGSDVLEIEARGYAPQQLAIAFESGAPTIVVVRVLPLPVVVDEIVVRPSRLALLQDTPESPLALGEGEIEALPHLGDDVFRALPLLPGLAANDFTARFHVHGGRRDEVQIRLDGLELYDAFHLKDFDDALSIVSADSLDSVEITTGGWSAERGDRMSGVLDMRTRSAGPRTRTRLALSSLTASAGASGPLRGDRGDWMALGRVGSITLVSRLLGDEDPHFADLFARVSHRLGEHQGIRGSLLWADDELRFQETVDGDSKRTDTEYGSRYLWGSHDAVLGRRLSAQTTVGWSAVDRDRRGFEAEEEQSFTVLDRRDFEVLELRSDWSLWSESRHAPNWGMEARRYSVDYDYSSVAERDAGLPIIPPPQIEVPEVETPNRFVESVAGNHLGIWLGDRLRPVDALTLDLGLRVDDHSWVDDTVISPRLSAAWQLGARSVLRGAWGLFHQSQRPYELSIQDGETTFSPPERSEHWILGYERALGRTRPSLVEALRLETYARDIRDPRPRYENLFEPYNVFPEVEPDRVEVVPERSRSHGFEALLRGSLGPRAGWWANYSLARVEDRLQGEWVRRQTDQLHALNVVFEIALGRAWRLSTAWRYHTGWPTTPVTLVTLEAPDGDEELALLLGDLNSERVADYHRLDLRASRRLRLRRGELLFFVDVQNLYDRQNVAGFDYSLDDDDNLEVEPETWAGILPSLGVRWEF